MSTQGSNSNPGSSGSPFRTITYAYSRARAGDRIIVLPGMYTDYTSGWGLHVASAGSASSPIVLKSQLRGGAAIDGQNASDRNVGIYLDGSYNVIDGFEIRNSPNGGISIWGNNNQILNCEIHHNGNPASSSTNGRDGVYSDQGTSGNIYVANSIHDNGRQGSNLDHGLYLCGQNEMVLNNVLVGNAASGLQVAGYTTVSNLRVYNNVMAWNGTSGIILWQTLSGVDIKNNIIYQNGHYGVGSYDAHGSGVVLDHNLASSNGYGEYDFTGGGSDYSYTEGTLISGSPQLVNQSQSGFDAHLATGSPAINAGVNLSPVFTTDKDGTSRPTSGPWDLGAYRYGATNPPVSTASLVLWTNPAAIVYGTALSSKQLNATADVAGTFSYSPAMGTVLGAGASQTLQVTFTPADAINYLGATATATISVSPAPLVVTATNATRPFGAGNPVFGGSIAGLQHGDNITATYTCAATVNSPAGTYAIVPTLVDPSSKLANYTVTRVNGVLTVTSTRVQLDPPARVGRSVVFSAQTVPGAHYVLEVKGSLEQPGWMAVQTNLGDGRSLIFTNAFGTNRSAFFRLRSP